MASTCLHGTLQIFRATLAQPVVAGAHYFGQCDRKLISPRVSHLGACVSPPLHLTQKTKLTRSVCFDFFFGFNPAYFRHCEFSGRRVYLLFAIVIFRRARFLQFARFGLKRRFDSRLEVLANSIGGLLSEKLRALLVCAKSARF